MKDRLKKALAALAVLAVASGVILATEAPAAANPPCPSGYACFYEHSGYSGSETDYYSGFRGQCVNLYGFWHDRISSFQNNIGGEIIMYRGSDCNDSQGSLWWYNNSGVSNLSVVGFNDGIDSIRFY